MIFFDAHVHFYKQFELDVLLTSFASHADIFARDADVLAMAVMLRGFQSSLDSVFEPFVAKGMLVGITYTLHETGAPAGCKIAADSQFTIDISGSVTSTGRWL